MQRSGPSNVPDRLPANRETMQCPLHDDRPVKGVLLSVVSPLATRALQEPFAKLSGWVVIDSCQHKRPTEIGFDQLYRMRRACAGRSRHMPSVSSPPMVYIEEGVALPCRDHVPDHLDKICRHGRRSNAEPMVRMTTPARRMHP